MWCTISYRQEGLLVSIIKERMFRFSEAPYNLKEEQQKCSGAIQQGANIDISTECGCCYKTQTNIWMLPHPIDGNIAYNGLLVGYSDINSNKTYPSWSDSNTWKNRSVDFICSIHRYLSTRLLHCQFTYYSNTFLKFGIAYFIIRAVS